jgi:EAL domain-containing protein (putative c-di-GMP-specific phosphodiesterase class I)/CheY-like chemotaxis protein
MAGGGSLRYEEVESRFPGSQRAHSHACSPGELSDTDDHDQQRYLYRKYKTSPPVFAAISHSRVNPSESRNDALIVVLGALMEKGQVNCVRPTSAHHACASGRGLDGMEVLADACVMIVDDRDSNVRLLEKILRSAGMSRVHGFTDSRIAVQSCVELQPDLLLLDLHMPYLDGIEVLGQLRCVIPADAFLPVLVLTGDTTSTAREQALDAGAKDFLSKPFDWVEVLQRVRNLLELRALYVAMKDQNDELKKELDRTQEEGRREALEREVARARVEAVLADGLLQTVFQPILDLGAAKLIGVEALTRFDCEPRRPPDLWFAEATRIGLGPELELAAIEAALAHLVDLSPDLFLSVNASSSTAASPAFAEVLARHPASRIVLELTEHDRIDDLAVLVAALDNLRGEGVRIAVDDTGAGYAGFQQIVALRPEIIKLDVDITRGVDSDPVRRAMAAALVQFGNDTGAIVVAEGIETPTELATLRELTVPWGQGYYLGRPGPLAGLSSR